MRYRRGAPLREAWGGSQPEGQNTPLHLLLCLRMFPICRQTCVLTYRRRSALGLSVPTISSSSSRFCAKQMKGHRHGSRRCRPDGGRSKWCHGRRPCHRERSNNCRDGVRRTLSAEPSFPRRCSQALPATPRRMRSRPCASR